MQRAGATLHCCAWASHCGGFSCCGAWALDTWASVVVAHGLTSCGSQALEHRLSSCGAQAQLLRGMWDLPCTRARTHVPCTGKWILNNRATRATQYICYDNLWSVIFDVTIAKRLQLTEVSDDSQRFLAIKFLIKVCTLLF